MGTPSQDHGSILVEVEWRVFQEFLDKLNFQGIRGNKLRWLSPCKCKFATCQRWQDKGLPKKLSEISIVFANNYGKMPWWKHPLQRPFTFKHHASLSLRETRECIYWSVWLEHGQPHWGKEIIILRLWNKSRDRGKYCIMETCSTWVVLCFWAKGFTKFIGGYEEEALVLKGSGCIFNWHVGKPNLKGSMGQRPPSRHNDLPWF